MKYAVLILCFSIIVSCKTDKLKPKVPFTMVEVEEILVDSTLNSRVLEVDANGEGVFATANGKLGIIFNAQNDTLQQVQSAYGVYANTLNFKHDSITPHFRAIARTPEHVFLLSVASPALLYKVSEGDTKTLVYKEEHPKVFYDAMAFWNAKEGIAMGDPTDDCISIIITRDGGDTWTKVPCNKLPRVTEGEAAFAASNTNIAIVGDETWIATGGKRSRILYSKNKGKTWKVFETPIIQGEPTTGMYSLDFYDAKNGFAIGGDYTKPDENFANKIRTQDGGKTWQLVAQGENPGYRSCIQYVPDSDAKALVAVGFKGIDYSSDGGDTWTHLSDQGFYTLRFIDDATAYATGKGRVAKLRFK